MRAFRVSRSLISGLYSAGAATVMLGAIALMPRAASAQEPQGADTTVREAGAGAFLSGASAGARDRANAFVQSKGWKSGWDAPSGQFTAVGVASIDTGSGMANLGSARIAAFEQALADAKAQIARSAGESISRQSENLVLEGTPGMLESVKAGIAQGSRSMNDLAVAVVTDAIVQELKSRGVDMNSRNSPILTNAVKDALATQRLRDLVSATSQSRVGGVTAYQVFEALNASGKGEIAVVAVQTERSRQIADAAAGAGQVPLMTGAARPALDQQIPADDQLIYTMGVQPRFDERGNLVLLGFGQASPISADAAGIAAAQKMSELAAKGALRSFAGEVATYDADLLTAKDSLQYADGSADYRNGQALMQRFAASASRLRMDGMKTLKNGVVVHHPANQAPIVMSVVAWMPAAAPDASAAPAPTAAPAPLVLGPAAQGAPPECKEGEVMPGVTQLKVRGSGTSRSTAVWAAIYEAVTSLNGASVSGNEEVRTRYEQEITTLNDSVSRALTNNDKLNQAIQVGSAGGMVRQFRVLSESLSNGQVQVDVCVQVQKFDARNPRPGSLSTIAVLPLDLTRVNYSFTVGPGGKDGDCQSVERPGTEINRGFVQELVSMLVNTKRFRVLDREFIEKVLKEQSLVKANSMEPQELVKLGRILGADHLVVGTLEAIGTNCRRFEVKASGYVTFDFSGGIEITYRVLNVASGEIESTSRIVQTYDTTANPDLRGVLSSPDGAARFFVQQIAGFETCAILDAIDPVKVAAVQGTEVVLNQGKGRPMFPGARLRVIGKGEVIRDPDSGAVLSDAGGEVGVIEIFAVEDRISRARVIAGDAAKITIGNICKTSELPPLGAPPGMGAGR